MASTYPLEIIQLQQWMERNKDLQGQALADAVQKQCWDPSIQSMVAVPDVIERLAGNIQWTTELGNAFLAQPEDVMAAVQRMRGKAQGPSAPLGELDFVIKGAMIGGFALAAAPAEYQVTGVKTFIVSHTGIVYEKDLGPDTLQVFQKMERFDPDSSWQPTDDEW